MSWICLECDFVNFDHLKRCTHCEAINPIYDESKMKNCWSYMKCPEEIKKNCKVYKKDIGKECWFFMEEDETDSFLYKKYKDCINCPWFKKLNLKPLSNF